MKKTIFTLLAAVVLSSVGFAQNGAFKNGDKLLNVGVGVNSYYSGGIPIGASFEVGVTDAISVGGGVDYLSYKYSNMDKFTATYIGVRGNYHFNELLKIDNDNVDLYGGLTLGYRVFSWKNTSYPGLGGSYGSGLFFGVLIGGKNYFSDNIGAFLELGAIGSTNARLGIAFKF